MVQSKAATKVTTEGRSRRERRLRALERILAHHREVLERRGEPVDVDTVIDEIRGDLG